MGGLRAEALSKMSILVNPAPETQARKGLIKLLKTEFAVEKIPVKGDKLHGSIGFEGAQIGVYPVRTSPWARDQLVADMEIAVQFFGKYDLKVDPLQVVDPTKIESFAERFRGALQEGVSGRNAEVWYFNLVRLVYPPDPTGNITRFVATLVAYGNNSALLETS